MIFNTETVTKIHIKVASKDGRQYELDKNFRPLLNRGKAYCREEPFLRDDRETEVLELFPLLLFKRALTINVIYVEWKKRKVSQ